MSCFTDMMKPTEASSCCKPQDTAAHAARAMRDSGCGCAPVVEDTEHLKLVGVVNERDVCCSLAADDRRASEVRVQEIMRQPSRFREVVAHWTKRVENPGAIKQADGDLGGTFT